MYRTLAVRDRLSLLEQKGVSGAPAYAECDCELVSLAPCTQHVGFCALASLILYA